MKGFSLIVALNKKKQKVSKETKSNEKQKPQESKKAQSSNQLIRHSDFFSRIKPKNNYYFFSDYFTIDDKTYGAVLTLLHNDGADNRLTRFWGVLVSLNHWSNSEEFKDVRIRFINQARKRTDNWIKAKQEQSERVVASDKQEAQTFSTSDKKTVGENEEALNEVMEEIRKGASYLDVRMHYLIKAPSLEVLDNAVRRLNRSLRDDFDTVTAKAFNGAQRQKLNMLLDIDKYRHHVIVASEREAQTLSYTQRDLSPNKPLLGSDMWGVKIGQVALMNRHRVVHFVLNNADIASVGLDLSRLTANVDMNQGALNPFEAFGNVEDELTIFPALLEKIKLMTLMMAGGSETEKSRIRTELTDILTDFYIDKGMWTADSTKVVNRQSIRLVGLPHTEYPRLPEFTAYLRQEYDRLANGETLRCSIRIRQATLMMRIEILVLFMIFQRLLLVVRVWRWLSLLMFCHMLCDPLVVVMLLSFMVLRILMMS